LPLNGKKYDLIVCRNVLYQLSDSGQKVALYNFTRSMRDDSLLMIGLGGELGGIKFPDLKDWFNEEFQRELELKIVENTYDTVIQRI
jgi:chemotaxis methyl-accepting protein methylase